MMSLETQCHVGCLVINKVAGKYASGYQNQIEMYINHNGPEWTVRRLKAIWTASLHLKGGQPERARALYQENSISYHRRTMVPKGPIGPVVTAFVESRKPAVMRRWAATLRFYTGLKLPTTSWTQFKKAYRSINDPSSVQPEMMLRLSKEIVSTVLPTFHGQKVSLRKDDIYADGLRGTSKYYSAYQLPKDMKAMPYSSMAMSLKTTSWVPESIDRKTPCFEMREILRADPLTNDEFVGKISFLQEGGCKGRVVAQPTAWLQLAFKPLHKALVRFTRKQFARESCVENQESGIWGPLEAISKGRDVISVDLSSATDRLPRVLQMELLKALGLEDYAIALDAVCQRPFKAEYKGNTFPFYYRVGQPMGLYGSFPLLNITNMVIGRYSEIKAGIAQDAIGTTFNTIGDDIVFLDDRVASIYTETMSRLGVEVSPLKCHSGRVAEFAGFVVLPTSTGATAFRPYKVPSGEFLTNPMEFLHALGVECRSISRPWAKRYEAYRRCVKDMTLSLTPLLPVEDSPMSSSFRADNRWLLSLCQRIDFEYQGKLPDLGGDTHINSEPLFREQRPMDLYGFNPEVYKTLDVAFNKALHMPGVSVYNSVDKNPVMKESLDRLNKELTALYEERTRLKTSLASCESIRDRLTICKDLARVDNLISSTLGVTSGKEVRSHGDLTL